MPRYSQGGRILIIEDETLDTETVGTNIAAFTELRYKQTRMRELRLDNAKDLSLTLHGATVEHLIVDTSSIRKLIILQSTVGQISIGAHLDPEIIYHGSEINAEVEGTIGWMSVTRSKIGTIYTDAVHIARLVMKDNIEIGCIRVEASSFSAIEISQSTTNSPPSLKIGEISISDSRISTSFKISDCELADFKTHQVWIDSILVHRITSRLVHISAEVKDQIYLNQCTIERLVIGDGIFNKVLLLLGTYTEVSFHPSSMKSLFTGSGYRKHPSMRQRIEKLNMAQFPKIHECQIKINDVEIGELDLSDFDNHGGFELSNAEIERCYLKLTRLRDSVLNSVSFKKMVLLDSIIDEARFANIVWPKNHLIDEAVITRDGIARQTEQKHSYIKLAEAYRQLKVLCLNGNDKYNALAFHKNEMNQVWKVATIEKQENLGNWLILGSNKLFSDFGQSLFLPLMWLLGVHSLLFCIMWLQLGFGLESAQVSAPLNSSPNCFWRPGGSRNEHPQAFKGILDLVCALDY